MKDNNSLQASVIPFIKDRKCKGNYRKHGRNANKEGSVRKINGKIYVDFVYLGERVREPSGLAWNDRNAKFVREQLDGIIAAIKSGTFRYGEVFQHSKKKEYFRERETRGQGLKKAPCQVVLGDYVRVWYDLLKASNSVTERTLLGYKSYINNYLEPFFDKKTFDELGSAEFSQFISWAKSRCYMKKKLKNETVNKIFVVLKMICKSAARDHRWGSSYNPFQDFKKLPEGEAYEKIHPFSVEKQGKIIDHMPDHWKPYFRFAFCSGLRQGEQFGLKPDDIDWEKGLLHIRRAITRDENGKIIEGRTKNKYSRRTIKLTPVMYDALRDQKKVFDRYRGEYFFCNMNGDLIRQSNLLRDAWLPALKEAKIKYREMKQTRHSFATIALSCGENPLRIAKVMGHKNTDMIIRVYMKHIENENGSGSEDGKLLDSVLSGKKK